MSDILHVGISALMAYQAAINVASQNIANADTTYYNRRQANFEEIPFGSGVRIADVQRIFDETASNYLISTTSDFSKWNLYLQQLGNFEPLLDNGQTSIGKFITDSLGALKQIESNFTSTNRQLFLDKLTALSQQFQSVNAEISRQTANVNSSLQTVVDQTNSLLVRLADLNQQIIGESDARPELLDQREGLMKELAKYVDFSSNEDQNGNINLSLKNGLPLLTGNIPATLTTFTDPANPAHVLVGAKNGATVFNISTLIEGGELAAWVNYRQNGLEAAQTSLDRLALVIAQTINAQNRLGADGNAGLGGNIFTDINSTNAINNRVIANQGNTGTSSMTVNIDNVNQLQASDYKLVIGTANAYTLIRMSDNTTLASGTIGGLPQTISAEGFSVNIASGTFNSGDQYIISPTNGAAGSMNLSITDPSQLALGWPVAVNAGVSHPSSDGSISVTNIVDTTNAAFAIPKQLDPPIRVVFSVSGGITQYSLYNANTNVLMEGPLAYTNGAEIFPTPGGYDPGYRVTISGSNIQDTDTFEIKYNTNVSSDNRNAIALRKAYQAGSVLSANGQLVSFNEAYGLISSDISVKTNGAQARFDTSRQIMSKAQARRDSISGVSLEEETLSLAQFQTAYQASAQVLQTAKSIFEIIVSIAR